jgi:hypothetical protein
MRVTLNPQSDRRIETWGEVSMTCVELQESLAEREDASSPEQRAHLRTCPACTALVNELALIIASAPELSGTNEPSPRVWNSIVIALRQEGLIRPQRPNRSLLPSLGTPWAWARWLAPAAAMLLIAVGLYVRQHSLPSELEERSNISQPAQAIVAGLNDADFLQEIAATAPSMKDQYEQNLRVVNQSIQDAEVVVKENPNDEDARRSLLDAYQQKAMLFEMAMDRSMHP